MIPPPCPDSGADEVARAQRRAAFLAEASTQLAGSLDYETTLAGVARLAVPDLADWCLVDIVEEGGRIRRVGVAHADPTKADVARKLHHYPPPPDAPVGIAHVLRTGQAAIISNVDEAFLRAVTRNEEHLVLARAFAPRSGMTVPLVARGRTLGAITLYYAESDRRYGPDDLALAEELARRAALAVDNARLYRAEQDARHRAERAAERTDRLQALAADLAEALTPARVVQVVTEHGMAALGATTALVGLLSEDRGELELVHAVGYPNGPLAAWRQSPVGAPMPLAEAVWTGELVLVDAALSVAADASTPAGSEGDTPLMRAAEIAIPLVVEGRVVGALELGFAEPRAFDEDDRALMLAIGRQPAQAIERARLYEAERRVRAEAQAAEARYRNLFEGAPDAVLVFVADGRVVDANPAATELLGYSVDELRRMRLAGGELVVEGAAWAGGDYRRLLEEGCWRGELELRRKDGSTVPVEAWLNAVHLPDGTIYRATVRDVSERRALERMQQEFIAMVSHELRNPLTALSGFAQLLQRQRRYNERAVTMILSQARQLERLIGDLLEVSRLEAGRLELRRTEMDLAQLVRVAVERTQALTDRHAIRVDAPPGQLRGWWDADRLEQVLHNLLSNAVKYSPAGGEITVRVEGDGAVARVAVADQGVGIAPGALPRLFDRFYRAEATASGAQGLGLGLYISRSLVQAHGGRMWAESTPGRGSTFVFTLPYGGPEDEEPGGVSSPGS